jgi:hypothetical protein
VKRLCWCSLLMIVIAAPLRGQEVPSWVREAAATSVPVFGPKTSAVVLLDEQKISVESDGRLVTTNHHVVRILTREGRARAVARAVYRTDGGKVRGLNAWLLRASVPVKKYDRAVDIAAVNNDIYNEVRAKVISATDDSDPGSVFAYESITEERSIFTQFDWQFQDELPALISRAVLSMPAGWTASSLTFNHSAVDPAVAGSTYTWELRNLPPIDPEPSMPALDQIAARLVVTFAPAAGANEAFGPSFRTWKAVSQWLSTLNETQIAPTPALSAEVERISATAKSDLEKIRAIARYAQSIQYISIQTGLGRGGGYKPHTAGEIFAKSYGDCKDKVTLMRAMLKVAGIVSYSVGIYSGDPYYVRESWPSPQQFNHAIIAIGASDSTLQAVSILHPALGRLAFFDPTDPYTVLGDLPEQLQGSLGLIVADDKGGLVRLPTISPEKNVVRRQTEFVLLGDGSIEAKMQENAIGQAAASMRAEFQDGSPADFIKKFESWISRTVPGATVNRVDAIHAAGEDDFRLQAEFRSVGYAQLMNNRLLVFKPVIVNRSAGPSFSEASREYPILIQPRHTTDIIRVKLPDGFKVDDLPDAVNLETSFGIYSASFEVAGGMLVMSRNLSLPSAIIPATKYADVRSFFLKISAAEQAPVVLLKN